MGGYDEGTEGRRAAAGTIGVILLGTLIAFGPGGIHGLVHWSSRPDADPQEGDSSGRDPDRSGLEVVDAEAGAERGEQGTAEPVEPRIPLGREPLPALPHEVQERVRSVWDQPPITVDTDAEPPRLAATGEAPGRVEQRAPSAEGRPPDAATPSGDASPPDEAGEVDEAGEADGATPRLIGAAPASEAEVISALARQAGIEAARAFVGELNALFAPPDPNAEGGLEETAPLEDGVDTELEDELAQQSVANALSAEDVWEPTTQPRTPEEDLRERALRDQERAQSAALTAWAIQQALIPLFAGSTPMIPGAVPPGSAGVAPGSAVPVSPPVTSTGTPMPSPGVGLVGAPELPASVVGAPAATGGAAPFGTLAPFGGVGVGGEGGGVAGPMAPGTNAFGDTMGGVPPTGVSGAGAAPGGSPLTPFFPPSAPLVPGSGLAPGIVMPPGASTAPLP